MPKELPHAIPALRDPDKLEKWIEREKMKAVKKGRPGEILKEKSRVWDKKGDRTYEVEFAPFLDTLMRACDEALLENDGSIKIVSFGGGKMEGMLTLRASLEEGWRQKTGKRAKIEIVDFSLSKALAAGGGMTQEQRDPSAWEGVTLHIGPIELRDLSDAQDASIMVSMYGPFCHADKRYLVQLIVKAVQRLPVHGKAFLHIRHITPGQEMRVKQRIEQELGKNFHLDLSLREIEGPFHQTVQLLTVERMA